MDLHWNLIPSSAHVTAIAWAEQGALPGTLYLYGDLWAAFHNGAVYRYKGVSRSDYEAILKADSIGSALHRLGITNSDGRTGVRMGAFDPETGELRER